MKYKLIKEYPGSPKIGLEIHDNGPFWESDFSTKNVELFHISNIIFNPENYPEFWEQVVEKDYEILSFINDEKLVWNKAKDCRFDAKWRMYRPTEEDCLNETRIYIHSVKRLSDGEIFTIGDKVSNIYDKDITIINKFGFNHDTITINGNYARLSEINKSKQPLFTTEQRSEIEEIIKNIIK